jgi:hypothetical protein
MAPLEHDAVAAPTQLGADLVLGKRVHDQLRVQAHDAGA